MKETKEVTIAFLKLAQILAASFKDGAQVADFAVILGKIQAHEAEFKAAYEDIEKVKEEVKDVTLQEILEILPVVIPEIALLLKEIKKDSPEVKAE